MAIAIAADPRSPLLFAIIEAPGTVLLARIRARIRFYEPTIDNTLPFNPNRTSYTSATEIQYSLWTNPVARKPASGTAAALLEL
jgi:hypothetical protein